MASFASLLTLFFAVGQRWSHNNLTWSLRRSQQQGGQLGRELVRRELGHALQVWAAHTQLSFVELFDSDRADIQVLFHSNYHGDGEGPAFFSFDYSIVKMRTYSKSYP